MICDIIVVTMFPDYVNYARAKEIQGTLTVFMIFICQIITGKFLNVNKRSNYLVPRWGLFLFIPVCSMGMIYYLIVTSLKNRDLIILEASGLLIINMVAFYLNNTIQDIFLKNMEKEIEIQNAKIYAHQLEVISNTQERVKALQHDMKFHIRELIAMAQANNMKNIVAYLAEMSMQIDNPKEYVYSGNKKIDGTLNYLLHEAREKLKNIEVKLAVPEAEFFNTYDINIIVSNLLDNAITAAENSGNKYLRFEMILENSLLYLTIENSYSGIIRSENGNIMTNKTNCHLHGVGLKNVRKIVKKYNGTLNIEYSDNLFCVEIMLYMSEVMDL